MTVAGSIERETSPEAIAAWRAARRSICATVFAPKSRLTLSQWADRYRHLSSDLGEPGPWRTSRVPYLRGPMDAITDPRVRRVSVMKSARIGATQGLVLNMIGYCIHQDPTSIIIGLPTIGDAQKFSKSLLDPMLDVTDVVRERIDGGTMLEKVYSGGQLHIIGTQSPRAMRMVHGRYIGKSEIDAWEGSAGDDGDPYNVIDKRAGAYGAPKFVEESTPLVKETSRIEPAFEAGSKEFFMVPCPHCGERQRLVWGGPEVNFGIKWDRKPDGSPKPETAYYVCLAGCVIEESSKYRMIQDAASLENHGWVATHPERTAHRSFHLNALVSPFDGARWSLLVEEWYATVRKPEKIRVFVNTVLGETYVEKGTQADADVLTQRRDLGDIVGYDDEKQPIREPWWNEELPVPAAAALLTRSIDTHDDRLETAVLAWGAGEECWLIDWEILPGDPATTLPWAALDERIGYDGAAKSRDGAAKSYRHASGRELIPRVTFIDAGGHHSKSVNMYARSRRHRRVFAIFGHTQARAPVLGRPTRNNAAKTIQYPIGVFAAKEALLARLNKIETPGPGYIHLPPWLADEQLAQLTAEKLVTMGDKRVFKKTRSRNEMTDLWVYGLAALHQLGPRTVARLGRIAAALITARGTPSASAAGEEAGVVPAAAPVAEPVKAIARKARSLHRRSGGGFVTGW